MCICCTHISLCLSPFLSVSIATIILSLLHSCWESRSLPHSISLSLSLSSSCLSVYLNNLFSMYVMCYSDKKRAKTFDSDEKRGLAQTQVAFMFDFRKCVIRLRLALSKLVISDVLISFSFEKICDPLAVLLPPRI